MNELIRRYPKFGDIFFIDENGNKRFVAGSDVTTEEANALQAVGVVYDVNGKTFDVVAGVNDKTFPWSIACDFEITAIPAESGDLAVTLQAASIGTFTYTKTDGTKAEFVAQLNVWLEANAPKWEAYMESENVAILQLSDYTAYENACTITGCTLVKRVGAELAAETSSVCRNQILQRTIYNGCCRAKLEEWATNATSDNNNPAERMDGTTKLFRTYPVSKSYFDGELGDGLRAHFDTYQDYLDACMVRPIEHAGGAGIMRYSNGKPVSDKLLSKKLLVRGVPSHAYPAAVWAAEYDCGVPGYGAGTFHLASMSELAILMRNITYGTKQTLDAINASLSKRSGWSRITAASGRWSCCRCDASSAWNFSGYGICGNISFYYRFLASPLARFELD